MVSVRTGGPTAIPVTLRPYPDRPASPLDVPCTSTPYPAFMHLTSETVEALVEHLSKLPTVGRKTAQRLAAFVLKMPREEVVELARALVAAKDKVKAVLGLLQRHQPRPLPGLPRARAATAA